MTRATLKLPTYKALSVRQPFAFLIVSGQKTIENRTWSTSHRGKLLIHASRNIAYFDQDAAWIKELGLSVPQIEQLPCGAIIGSVNLIDCRLGGPGTWDWHLTNPRSLHRPIPYSGRLGLFTVNL